jgi:hypothetical protein
MVWMVRGSNPAGGGEIFRTRRTDLGVLPASYTMGIGSLSRGLCGRGVALITHPHLAPSGLLWPVLGWRGGSSCGRFNTQKDGARVKLRGWDKLLCSGNAIGRTGYRDEVHSVIDFVGVTFAPPSPFHSWQIYMAMECTVRPCTSRTDVNVARVEELILGCRSNAREDAGFTILRKWKFLFVIANARAVFLPRRVFEFVPRWERYINWIGDYVDSGVSGLSLRLSCSFNFSDQGNFTIIMIRMTKLLKALWLLCTHQRLRN